MRITLKCENPVFPFRDTGALLLELCSWSFAPVRLKLQSNFKGYLRGKLPIAIFLCFPISAIRDTPLEGSYG